MYTPDYAPPEMRHFARDRAELDNYTYINAVDMWSIGIITFELLAKRVPFPTGDDQVNFWGGRMNIPLTQLRNQGTSSKAIDFVGALLQVNPEARPSAAAALELPWLLKPEINEVAPVHAVHVNPFLPLAPSLEPAELASHTMGIERHHKRTGWKSSSSSSLDVLTVPGDAVHDDLESDFVDDESEWTDEDTSNDDEWDAVESEDIDPDDSASRYCADEGYGVIAFNGLESHGIRQRKAVGFPNAITRDPMQPNRPHLQVQTDFLAVNRPPPRASDPVLAHRRSRSGSTIADNNNWETASDGYRNYAAPIPFGWFPPQLHPQPMHPQPMLPPPRPHLPERTVECSKCHWNHLPVSQTSKLRCGHRWCEPCLVSLFKMSASRPELMPPRCCKKEIPPEFVAEVLSDDFKRLWNTKKREQKTVPLIACAMPGCGEPIDPMSITRDPETRRKKGNCSACGWGVCVQCGHFWHDRGPCKFT